MLFTCCIPQSDSTIQSAHQHVPDACHMYRLTALDITEDVDLDETNNSFEEKHLSLSPKLGMELYKYYKLTQADKVSSMLITQYQKEMRMSKEQRSFPQFTVWLRQKEMEHESQTTNTSPLLEISNQAQPCQYYSIPDKFGRIIKFSKHVDKSSSVYSSCCFF